MGPIPDELAEQWDTAAWEAPAPYKKRRTPRRRHAPRSRLGGRVGAGNLRRRHRHQPAKHPSSPPTCSPPPVERLTADTPEDALAMSLDRNLRVDIDYIASAARGSASTTPARCIDGLVYPSLDDPDELIPATTALSGNVREKLHPGRTRPPSTTPPTRPTPMRCARSSRPTAAAEEIKARPGAPWIDPRVHRAVRPGNLRCHRGHRRASRRTLDRRGPQATSATGGS